MKIINETEKVCLLGHFTNKFAKIEMCLISACLLLLPGCSRSNKLDGVEPNTVSVLNIDEAVLHIDTMLGGNYTVVDFESELKKLVALMGNPDIDQDLNGTRNVYWIGSVQYVNLYQNSGNGYVELSVKIVQNKSRYFHR